MVITGSESGAGVKKVYLFRLVFHTSPEFAFDNEKMRDNAAEFALVALKDAGLEVGVDFCLQTAEGEYKPKSKAKLKIKNGGK